MDTPPAPDGVFTLDCIGGSDGWDRPLGLEMPGMCGLLDDWLCCDGGFAGDITGLGLICGCGDICGRGDICGESCGNGARYCGLPPCCCAAGVCFELGK